MALFDRRRWVRIRNRLARAIGFTLTPAQERYAKVLGAQVGDGLRWLDIGCGRQILPPWAADEPTQTAWVARSRQFVGIDFEGEIRNHTILREAAIASGCAMPLPDASFDLITATMVMEHIADPAQLLREVTRVLAPGGAFLFHTPNYLYYLFFLASFAPSSMIAPIVGTLERRNPQDVFPAYYRLNTSYRIRRSLPAAGLRLESLQTVGSNGSFQAFGPFGLPEVLVLKLLSLRPFRPFQTTIIALARKPQAFRQPPNRDAIIVNRLS